MSSVISLSAIAEFFKDELKLIEKGENAFESNHVMSFTFDAVSGMIRGRVQASMKKKVYEAEVFIHSFIHSRTK